MSETIASPPKIKLKTAATGLRPWVYRKMVERSREIPDGSLVALESRDGAIVGHGFYSSRSQIGVRVLRWGADPVDEAFLRRRIRDAVYLRRKVLSLDAVTDAYRVVNSEGDELSGLIVDRYADVASVEINALAWYERIELVESVLREELPVSRVVVHVSEKAAVAEGIRVAARPQDQGAAAVIRERGLRFHVDFSKGHKTGAFLDQRDNRQWLAQFVESRDVLDCCTYQGGFAIAASVLGKAGRVTGVDLDEEAIELAKRNAKLHQAPRLEFVHADAFDYLREVQTGKRRYDVVVLDPPKLAPSMGELPRAAAKYTDLNELGMKALKNHGLLFTCSCSGLVSEEMFLGLLRKAAARAGKRMRILGIRGAAPDHPVAPHFPEGRYLKAVLASVEEL